MAMIVQSAAFMNDRRSCGFIGRAPTQKVGAGGPYADYVHLLQTSAAHVYLTYPFVLSWSMLEAMAAGCLVVASNTAPVLDVIRDGENGRLVDFFDPEALAERVAGGLARPDEFRGLREAARAAVRDQYDLATRCLPSQIAWLDF